MTLARLLHPSSIAIVGLSADPSKHAHRVLNNLRALGFTGTIQGVHPSGEDVLDVRVFTSLEYVAEVPDAVVSAVPASVVPEVARDAAAIGAGSMIVFAGGFAETGEDGASLQSELERVSDTTSLRVLGPNSGGVIAPAAGVAMSFLTCLDRPADEIRSGPVGLVTQSGGTGSYVHNLAAARGGGLAASISTGNEVDIDVADGIEALARTDGVQAIGIVLETVRNGPRFVEALRVANELGKPVVVARLGVSDAGQELMASHTGALAGPGRVLDAVLEAHGVHSAATPAEMLEIAEILARAPRPHGPRVGVVTHSGGVAILLSDLAAASSVALPAPSEGLRAEVLPLIQLGAVANPLDMGGIIGGPHRFGETVAAFAHSGDFDVVLAVSSAHPRAHSVERAESLTSLHSPVPVVHLWMAGDVGLAGLERLRDADAAVTDEPRAAIGALRALCLMPDPDLETLARPTDAGGSGRTLWSEHCAKERVREWGLPVVDGAVAGDAAEAGRLAEELGFPVVVKVSSVDIAHKTGVGGVRLGLLTSEEVSRAFESVLGAARLGAPDASLDGALVERQVSGTEMLIGVVRDDTFGPMVVVGLGGVAAEAFDDVRMAPAGLSDARTAALARSLRGSRLLTEPRMGEPADLDDLAHYVGVLGRAVLDDPSIASVELNPIVWSDVGWQVIDAAIEARR